MGPFLFVPLFHFSDSGLPDCEDISMEMVVGRLVHINFWEGAMNFTAGSSRALPPLNFNPLHILHSPSSSPLGSCWGNGKCQKTRDQSEP